MAHIVKSQSDNPNHVIKSKARDLIGDGTYSSTDNAAMRWSGTSAKVAQDSGVLIDDSNNVSGVGTLGTDGNITVVKAAAQIKMNSSSTAKFVADGAAGSEKHLQLQTDAKARWTARSENTAESGSNAGSDFELARHQDTGAEIGVALGINRATGDATFSAKVSSTTLDVGSSVVVTGTLDEDDLSSDSNVSLATQQSIKAYVDGKAHVDSYPALWTPPHLFGDSLTEVTARGDNEAIAIYMGQAGAAYTTVSTRVNVTTAHNNGIGGNGAEIAVYTGTPAFGTGLTITRVGSTNVGSTYNSTGIIDTDITTSGISIGDHLWFVYWSDPGAGGAVFQLRGLLADDMQSGGVQVKTTAGKPSSNSTYAGSLAGASVVPAWIVWQVA